MNRFAISAIALACFAVPARAALAEEALAPKAKSSPNETPPPVEMVETEESHMRNPQTAIAGGVLLGLGLVGAGVGTGVLLEGANHPGSDGIGYGIIGISLLGGVGHLAIPGAIMLGIGASRVHDKRMADQPLAPTFDLAVAPEGAALHGTF